MSDTLYTVAVIEDLQHKYYIVNEDGGIIGSSFAKSNAELIAKALDMYAKREIGIKTAKEIKVINDVE